MPRELGRYTGNTIAEQIGVVRLQDDATAATRALIQGTGALAEKASETAALAARQYADTFQIDQRAAFTELTKKHQLDPEAFKAAWKGHIEGTMKNVPWAFRNEAATILGDLGSRGYANVVEFQNANQRKNTAASAERNRVEIGEMYIAAVRRKDTKEVERLSMQYGLHLEDMRRLQLIDDEGVRQERDHLFARGAYAAAADEAEAIARKRGPDAARKWLGNLDKDPAFAAARERPTSFATLKDDARRRIAEVEHEQARARAAALEGLGLQLGRLGAGDTVDYDALRRYQKAVNPKSQEGKIIGVALESAAELESFRAAPPASQAETIARLAKAIEDPKSPTLQADTIRYGLFARVGQAARKAYDDDSFLYAKKVFGADQGDLPDINWARPDAAALSRYAQMHAAIEARAGVRIAPLPAEALARLSSSWAAAPPQTRSEIAAALNVGMGQTLASRVIQSLSKDGKIDPASAYALSVAPRDPTLARSIFAGQEILATKEKPALSNEEEFQQAFNRRAGQAFVNGVDPGGAARARKAAFESARSLIALEAAGQGKLGQKVEGTVIEAQIDRVLGSVVRHNGKEIFPPSRTMDQSGFDTMIGRIRDQDAPKLKASDGSEVSITKALRAGVLENVGDGRYVIRLGEGYYLTRLDDPRRPFVIDRSFFEGVDARTAAEDLGAFTGGERKPNRAAPSVVRPWRPPGAPAPEWMRE